MSRKYEPVEKTITQQRLTHIFCDRCGKNFLLDPEEAHDRAGGQAEFNFQYGSAFDGEAWCIDLCDGCAGEIRGWLNVKQSPPMTAYCAGCGVKYYAGHICPVSTA